MVYMNHYDVGYTSYINNVDNQYMHSYFKSAATTAATMRNSSATNDAFIYTTHAWLMQRFLHCPCPQGPAPPPPVVSGVWTSTGDDRMFAAASPAADANRSDFTVRCLTQSRKGGAPGGCMYSGIPWSTGVCTATDGGPFICRLDSGKVLSGSLSPGGDFITFAVAARAGTRAGWGASGAFPAPWRKFTGGLSGLWYGPNDTGDYTVISHNRSTGAIAVWWDTSVSPAIWPYGNGTAAESDGGAVTLLIPSFSATPLHGVIASDGAVIQWGDHDAGSWHAHGSQCYPDACPASASVCAARTLNNPFSEALVCPSGDEVAAFTAAVERGDIVWHAGPFNWQPENMARRHPCACTPRLSFCPPDQNTSPPGTYRDGF